MNIKRMAEKVGMTRRPADHQCRVPYWDVVIDSELERFADQVLEEAAKVCEEKHANGNWKHDTRHECAAAIRALKGAKE